MRQSRKDKVTALLLLGAVTAAGPAGSETIPVGPGRLAEALSAASAGDLLVIEGVQSGSFRIDRPLVLKGGADAVIDGEGRASVFVVDAPDVTIEGLRIRHSGTSLENEDAGIVLTEKATGAHLRDNHLEGNLFGVFVRGAKDAIIEGNHIEGLETLRVNERGNGVHVWNAPGTIVANNVIRHGRDGIFVTTSRKNRFIGNDIRDLRFAVHYMHTIDSEVRDNRSHGNDVGYALMYSRRIEARDNLSVGDRDHGLLLNYVTASRIVGNAVLEGGEKCAFLYNTNQTLFTDNRFEGCSIGIHYTAGSMDNVITRNAFVANRIQVKYVGTRRLDWSADGVGNYWSDYANFDLDGDGIGDRAYRPNDMVDRVLWTHPKARILLNSPALDLLRHAQAQLPSLMPGGVIDSAPLMAPPAFGKGAGS